METFSATEAKQAFGELLDTARRAPVVIQRQGRDVAVLLSVQEFERLRGLRRQAFDKICEDIAREAQKRGMTEEILEDLLSDVS